ncbi:endonuclease/exonuclease/phosphatase family metal-dependent hydrolase [Christiangramia gaetbulicola]|uniref:Endonuclease/exonuclease/phosphatase family metal-dependent hydrolase n=1 Tax=Christiangramia gaetbulicola TaxID=703340 RepID=A0A2T6AIL9_9FLAO|nr:endonuclease/exonuclease/phosphatase family protein [Christiangramia gaetbulicola]PTX43642.1 endonuclease/exonuclease/phosphatase family metal-dependent hydrolase [Christiangramia gaetbulicola]
MKKLGLFDKFIFILNSLAATALLFSYLLPHIPPKSFPLLSVLSLGVPVLIILNALFLVYWLFRLKRQVLLSLIVLLLGYKYVAGFVRIPVGDDEIEKVSDLSLMSYNVRMFNAYEWTSRKDIPEKITGFIKENDPDILCVQEHYIGAAELANIYPYEYVKLKGKNAEFGSAIFSKFPIINQASLDFPHDGNNNAIYTDVVVNKTDTVRIFNVHFQSLNIKPGIDDLQKEDSKKLLGRIGYGFSLQQEQAEMLMEELKRSPYKTIIAGDFNNTSFSYIYNLIKQDDRYKDAFLEAGSGFGKSFKLNYFPLRIDFLLVEKGMSINEFRKFEIDFSDHYPVLTKIGI